VTKALAWEKEDEACPGVSPGKGATRAGSSLFCPFQAFHPQFNELGHAIGIVMANTTEAFPAPRQAHC